MITGCSQMMAAREDGFFATAMGGENGLSGHWGVYVSIT